MDIHQAFLSGERALFKSKDLKIYDTVFDAGESPLKESENIELWHCLFKWKYPFWYCNHIKCHDCTWFEMARAGVWYSNHIFVEDAAIEAPKNFRRCRDLTLKNVHMPNAAETLWSCDHVTLTDVQAKGDYFAMNCSDMEVSNLSIVGNYSFDGVKNAVISNSKLLSKDAFWNTENVTVKDSFISGEYLGWNAKNLTLINCTIESLQGMCYIQNLKMFNCKLINTTLAFEYSSVEAEIDSHIDSILNPTRGTIRAKSIGTLTLACDKVDPSLTNIICNNIGETRDE